MYSLLTTGRRPITLKFSGILGSAALDLGIGQMIAFLQIGGIIAVERHLLKRLVRTDTDTLFLRHS